jgi:putative SOS response-associated peptidase YedK
MQAIEFTSKSHDRMIPIPEHYKDWLDVQTHQLSSEQQAARQHSLETMARAYPLGIAGIKREAFYD